jgi:hypothetical protein
MVRQILNQYQKFLQYVCPFTARVKPSPARVTTIIQNILYINFNVKSSVCKHFYIFVVCGRMREVGEF